MSAASRAVTFPPTRSGREARRRRWKRAQRVAKVSAGVVLVGAVLAHPFASFGRRLRCYLRARHVPVRSILGGFRCAQCGKALADLEDAGLI